jgi:hypothetical protein
VNPKLLEGVVGRLSERLVAAILSPAFSFLSVGLLAWLWAHGWVKGWASLTSWWTQRTTAEGLAAVVIGLLIVLLLGSLANALTTPVIRAMEGYWPPFLAPVAERLRSRQIAWVHRLEHDFQAAAAAADSSPTDESTLWRSTRAEDALARFPADEFFVLPTRLGNTLRASELRPYYKYGFDPVRCWYQLWLVLPEATRNEIAMQRARLDSAAVAVIFCLATAVWTPWAWWSLPLAIVSAVSTYHLYAVPAAESYGDLVEAACDVHRPLLFTALRLRLPETPAQDHEVATFVNAYLQRGTATHDRLFIRPHDDA